jgi:Ca-activated chloride channel family protein
MKKYGAEHLPEYDSIKAALSAPSGAPARLTDDRRRRIMNTARTAAAFQPTFADRLARWLDFGFPSATRYAVLRALVPVAITILIVAGVGGLLLPSLSMSRSMARKRPATRPVEVTMMEPESVKLEYLKSDFEHLEDLPTVVNAVAPPETESASSTPSTESTPSTYFFRRAAPSAAPAPMEQSAIKFSPVIMKGLYAGRSEGGRAADPHKYGNGGGATPNADGEEINRREIAASDLILAPDKDSDGMMDESLADVAGKAKETRDDFKSDADGRSRITADFAKKSQALGGGVSTRSMSSIPSPVSMPPPPPAPAKPEGPQPSTFRAFGVNDFVETAQQPFSTFSIDVDSAAYSLARNFLNQGQLPPAEAVRTEEIVNTFDYHDTPPAGALFAVRSECAPSPFGPGLQLLRIGVKARHLGREENRRAVLTFLIDTSGSMSTPDRLGLVKQALRLLVDRLAPDDLVALIQFDSHARLVLDYTRAADKARILQAIAAIQTSGSTNLEEGMRTAYECARRAYQPGAGNRVLILSDGAANLGSSTAEDILAVVAESRKQGIFCSVYGVGRGGYNDVMLEALANKGDGAYVYLDTIDEARRVFVDDLAATLNTVAADVKIQVEFNPARIKVYRQLGYENRKLRKEDFRNDAIDAGEVGSGQAVTALYELSLVPNAPHGPFGTVHVRYRDTATGKISEIASPLAESMMRPRLADASPTFKLAAGAAEFAEILRGSPYAEDGDLAEVASLLRPVALDYSLDTRVQELLRLVEKAAVLKRGGN